MNSVVVYSFLGTQLDTGKGVHRWSKWRPTVSLFQHSDFIVNTFHLIFSEQFSDLAETVIEDIALLSPETNVIRHVVEFSNPWDFEEVYAKLLDLTESCAFDQEKEDYYFHITTGTHVGQICIFLLTESRRFPGKLVQTSPPHGKEQQKAGIYSIVDLDLSKYDRIADRFRLEARDDIAFLKSGIETKNRAFNELIELVEKVAVKSLEPILLTGPTGAGKSKLARQIYELKKQRQGIKGKFVELNCATLRGDSAMSTLFGHIRGAYTGAVSDRKGLLHQADGGVIFLDEIGELGMDEQAMLLHAIEEKRFLSVGSDDESSSDFQLICGTNKDLPTEINRGRFREDLFARINLWTFRLPGLRDRPEDILPNIEYELRLYEKKSGTRVSFNREALDFYISFATSPEAIWTANFRDLKASLMRLCTLSKSARIGIPEVRAETERLRTSWTAGNEQQLEEISEPILASLGIRNIDDFDRKQLVHVVSVCLHSSSLAEAGRKLFSVSRLKKGSQNDSDRIRKYLDRFGISWEMIKETSR